MESRRERCEMRGAAPVRMLLAIIAVGGLVLGCRLEVAPPRERLAGGRAADSVQILTELRAYYRDFSARDWLAFAEHFWPGADLTTILQLPGQDSARVIATSVPDFVAQAPHGPDSLPVFEERLLDVRITAAGDLAQAWARYRAAFGKPGAVSEWDGIDAFTLLRRGGRWRIVGLAFMARRPAT
jgi:hypothetical protein